MTDSAKARVLALEDSAPRYTSYPAAPHFKSGFPVEDYKAWLQAIPALQSLSLYVHIPFCERLCYYCGCHTTIANGSDRVTAYIQTLAEEIRLVSDVLKRRRRVSHLHFGGGSPTILSPAAFIRLMTTLKNRFELEDDAEIAIEADPRQMSEARIATFAAQGVNRISLGMQDIEPAVMAAVNRPQPFHLSWDAVRLCRAYGITQINLDLMYGLPGQSVDSICRTMEAALTLRPNRIAFFGYAHVPWMKKHMGMMGGLTLPDGDLRYDLYETGRSMLEAAGYVAIGIDHFVLPSDSMAWAAQRHRLRRNFQGYTTDTADALVGLGASSIGKFSQGYVQSIADLRLYRESVEAGRLPVNRGYHLNDTDYLHGHIISELMCYFEIDLAALSAQHALPEGYFSAALERMQPLLASGLVQFHDQRITITHPHLARLVARCFDVSVQEAALPARHSRTV